MMLQFLTRKGHSTNRSVVKVKKEFLQDAFCTVATVIAFLSET